MENDKIERIKSLIAHKENLEAILQNIKPAFESKRRVVIQDENKAYSSIKLTHALTARTGQYLTTAVQQDIALTLQELKELIK